MDFYDILFAKSQNKGGGGGGGGNPYDSVVFYDYDGSIVASYKKAEFTAMPENPTHEGLVAQGWNWTKAQIDDYLNDYPEATVNVGQMYITDDGKTRLYVHFEEGRTSPYLGLGVNGTVEVDWGDGSTTDTLTGTSLTTAVDVQHVYQPGDYVIKLTPTSGSFSIYGVSNSSHILKKNTATLTNASRVYASAVKKVELGLDVSIGTYAFRYCYSLTSITIPSSVTSFGTNAFSYCCPLASVTIPSGVTSIENGVFSNCYSLASVTIPSSVTSIKDNTFSTCYSLTSVTIPSNVTSIGANAFGNCYSLALVTIPSSVTSINDNAFYSCYSLTSVTIPSNVTSIGSGAFNFCVSLASATIPSGVTSIRDNTFAGCYSLGSITIPSSVTSIGSGAFNNCYSLTSVTIPSNVTSIGANAFAGCYSLASITIPSGVSVVASSTFSLCHGMAEYHFLSTTPPTLDNTNAFSNIQSDCIIYVPMASVEAYRTATNWSTYASQIQGE